MRCPIFQYVSIISLLTSAYACLRPVSIMEQMSVKVIDRVQRRVKEIRVFYDDQTWETFVPEKK